MKSNRFEISQIPNMERKYFLSENKYDEVWKVNLTLSYAGFQVSENFYLSREGLMNNAINKDYFEDVLKLHFEKCERKMLEILKQDFQDLKLRINFEAEKNLVMKRLGLKKKEVIKKEDL